MLDTSTLATPELRDNLSYANGRSATPEPNRALTAIADLSSEVVAKAQQELAIMRDVEANLIEAVPARALFLHSGPDGVGSVP